MLCGTYKGFLYMQTASSSLTTVRHGKKSLANNEARLLKFTSQFSFFLYWRPIDILREKNLAFWSIFNERKP